MTSKTKPISIQIQNGNDLDMIMSCYSRDGFVAIANVLSPNELEKANSAVNEAVKNDRLEYFTEAVSTANPNQEMYGAHPYLSQLAKHPKIVKIARNLVGTSIELQHAKLSLKPSTKGKGAIPWHQDFPFFPHTNFDLLAC